MTYRRINRGTALAQHMKEAAAKAAPAPVETEHKAEDGRVALHAEAKALPAPALPTKEWARLQAVLTVTAATMTVEQLTDLYVALKQMTRVYRMGGDDVSERKAERLAERASVLSNLVAANLL